MLHTLSHQWPTPSEPVVTDPVTFEVKGRTEVERRSSYFNKIGDRASILIPTIKSCLNNIPKNRVSIVQVCSQLEGLVDKQDSSTDEIDMPSTSLQQEIRRKDAEMRKKDDEIHKMQSCIHSKDSEIEALKSDMAKLQMQPLKSDDPTLPRQVTNH